MNAGWGVAMGRADPTSQVQAGANGAGLEAGGAVDGNDARRILIDRHYTCALHSVLHPSLPASYNSVHRGAENSVARSRSTLQRP